MRGAPGIQNRVNAWEVGRGKQLPKNFSTVFEDFDLTGIPAIAEQTPKGSVLIIDTLNRVTAGN